MSDNDNDDEDDLPEPFTPPVKKSYDEYEEGDLVFAKYPKFPFWPAVFFRYLRKAKKRQKSNNVLVHYLEILTESNRKIVIKTPIQMVKPYNCEERKEIIKIGTQKYGKDFVIGIERAEEYLRKKALGKIDPKDYFFDIEMQDEYESDETEDQEDTEIKSKIDLDCTMSKKVLKKRSFNTFFTKLRSRNQDLMAWIKEESRSHLRQILHEEISSRRHCEFLKGTVKQKNYLKWDSGFGPINEQEAEELIDTLSAWFKEDNVYDYICPVGYVFDVWVPEAIIRSISKVRKMSYEEAEEEYLRE